MQDPFDPNRSCVTRRGAGLGAMAVDGDERELSGDEERRRQDQGKDGEQPERSSDLVTLLGSGGRDCQPIRRGVFRAHRAPAGRLTG
jgi:hypothetical protein